jgi:hypothetical protein
MPTPLRFFIKIAQERGNINPDDIVAVENWFLEDLPKLPEKDLQAILDELIEHSDDKSIKPDKIVYPSDIPMPLMKDTIPVTGLQRTSLYSRLINNLKKLIASKK